MVYLDIDDVLISVTDTEEHLGRLDMVLQRLVFDSRTKSAFFVSSVSYLVHCIDGEGLYKYRRSSKL